MTTCPCGNPAKVMYCSRVCAGRYNTPPVVGVPVGTVLCTCPCGADVIRRSNQARERELRRKFCSKACAGKFGGGKPPAPSECRACGADLTDEANVYRYKSGPRRGSIRCRRCVLAAGQPDYVPGPKGAPKAQAGKRRPRPKPVPEPTPIRSEPEVPVWRPPGWAPVPQVRRVAS